MLPRFTSPADRYRITTPEGHHAWYGSIAAALAGVQIHANRYGTVWGVNAPEAWEAGIGRIVVPVSGSGAFRDRSNKTYYILDRVRAENPAYPLKAPLGGLGLPPSFPALPPPTAPPSRSVQPYRTTLYEVVLAREGEVYLLAYVAKANRVGLLSAIRLKGHLILALPGAADRTVPGPYGSMRIGAWTAGFSGRTQRDAFNSAVYPSLPA